jgi:hypothetical protein
MSLYSITIFSILHGNYSNNLTIPIILSTFVASFPVYRLTLISSAFSRSAHAELALLLLVRLVRLNTENKKEMNHFWA